MTKSTITIHDHISENQVELPVEQGSLGAPTIDVRKLKSGLGYFTFDPGYATTASYRTG